MRESPPECLLDPQLGRHLHVKINVREKKTKTSQFHFAPDILTFQGLQVPLCGGRVSSECSRPLSARLYRLLVRMEEPIKGTLTIILGGRTRSEGRHVCNV